MDCSPDASIIKIISNLRFNRQSRAHRSQMPKQGVEHASPENRYERSLVFNVFDTDCVISRLSRIFELYSQIISLHHHINRIHTEFYYNSCQSMSIFQYKVMEIFFRRVPMFLNNGIYLIDFTLSFSFPIFIDPFMEICFSRKAERSSIRFSLMEYLRSAIYRRSFLTMVAS